MKLKTTVPISTVLASTVLASVGLISQPCSAAELSANAGITSNYVFRGFTQSNNDAALQGGVDYNHDSGAYAGVWASTVDDVDGNGDGLEVDFYVGFGGESDSIEFDVGYISYEYTDSDFKNGAFHEFYIGGGYGPASVTYYIGDDTEAGQPDYNYLDVKFKLTLPDDIDFDAHYGRYDPDGGTSYNDFSVGLSKVIMDVEVSITGTTEDKPGSKDEKLFLTIIKTFDL